MLLQWSATVLADCVSPAVCASCVLVWLVTLKVCIRVMTALSCCLMTSSLVVTLL
jgi:hypothetical protein